MSGLKSILCLFDGHESQLAGLTLATAPAVPGVCSCPARHRTGRHLLELDQRQQTAMLVSKRVSIHHIAALARHRVNSLEGGKWHDALEHDTFYETGVGFEAMAAFTDKIIPRIARTNDLVVCTKSVAPPTAGPDVFLSTRSRSGRPVLLVPSHPAKAASGRLFDGVIAVAWDRSIQATRAIHNLLPCLGQNAIVEKLIGGTTIEMYRQAKLPLLLTH